MYQILKLILRRKTVRQNHSSRETHPYSHPVNSLTGFRQSQPPANQHLEREPPLPAIPMVLGLRNRAEETHPCPRRPNAKLHESSQPDRIRDHLLHRRRTGPCSGEKSQDPRRRDGRVHRRAPSAPRQTLPPIHRPSRQTGMCRHIGPPRTD